MKVQGLNITIDPWVAAGRARAGAEPGRPGQDRPVAPDRPGSRGVGEDARVNASGRGAVKDDMTEKTVRVGDVVAWADVPDGALVRDADGFCAVRKYDRGAWVFGQNREWTAWIAASSTPLVRGWPWAGDVPDGCARVTIVALGLTGHESADDLRRMAEVFEVREALLQAHGTDAELWHSAAWGSARQGVGVTLAAVAQDAAERLHAAGWRPGMTAEDAARLLAEGKV